MSFQDHIENTNNPHNVTKEQIGLGNVESYPIASVDEIMKLERNDRYIDYTQMEVVRNAFSNYLQELKLLDEVGNIINPPSELNDNVVAEVGYDGVGRVYGYNPLGRKVTARVYLNGQMDQEYTTRLVDANTGYWEIVFEDTTFLLDSIKEVRIIVYDGLERIRERGTTAIIDVRNNAPEGINPGAVSFTIDGEGKSRISGTSKDMARVEYVLMEASGIVVTSGTIDQVNAEGHWSVAIDSPMLSRLKTYDVELSIFDPYDNKRYTDYVRATDQRTQSTPSGQQVVSVDQYKNSVNGTVTAAYVVVTVYDAEKLLYTGVEEITNDNGNWQHVITTEVLDEQHAVYVDAFTATGDLVATNLIDDFMDRSSGGVIYEDLGGLHWLDQRQFGAWKDIQDDEWDDGGEILPLLAEQSGGVRYVDGNGEEWYDQLGYTDWKWSSAAYQDWLDYGKIAQ